MNGKTKFLIIALLLVVALSLFLGHFWSFALCALQNAIASGLVPICAFSQSLPGIGARFLL